MILAAVTAQQLERIAIGGLALALILAVGAAGYGKLKRYPFFPLLVVGLVLPFSSLIVLLIVAITRGGDEDLR